MGEAPDVESGSVSGSGGSFQTDAPRSAGAATLWKPRGTGSLGCLVELGGDGCISRNLVLRLAMAAGLTIRSLACHSQKEGRVTFQSSHLVALASQMLTLILFFYKLTLFILYFIFWP